MLYLYHLIHYKNPSLERKQGLKRNVLLYQLTLVFGKNGLVTPVIYFFLTTIKGFTAAQSLFIVGFAALAMAITEVPTGVVADKFSRKYLQKYKAEPKG